MVRVVATKKIDLAEVYEGWTSDCYAIVRPSTTPEVREFFIKAQEQDASEDELQDTLIRDHLVSCHALVEDDDGKQVIAELSVEDVISLPDLSDKIAAACIRSDLDPKALREAALNLIASTRAEKSTVTQ